MTLTIVSSHLPIPGEADAPLFGGASETAMLGLAVIAVGSLLISLRRRIQKSQRQGQSALSGHRMATRSADDFADGDRSVERSVRVGDLEAAAIDASNVMLELDELSRQIHGRIDTKIARLEAVLRDANARIEQLSRLIEESHRGRSVSITLDDESSSTDRSTASPAEASDKSRDVCRLAREGLSTVQIAKALHLTPGEVELILGLQKAGNPEGRVPDSIRATS